MKCRNCNFDNPDTMHFCGKCGAKLEQVCQSCNFENPPEFEFCGKCGRQLEESVSRKTDSGLDGERKQITALISDLSSYTAMSERLDPEEVKSIMSRIFGQVAKIIATYDGSIQKCIGDAVVAFFGVPKAHEDDAIRAVRAAQEIHKIVSLISPEIEEKLGNPLSMHTGINTGLVVTGEVTAQNGVLGVTGDTVNVASRLSGHAKPGEILVGQDTYRQAGRYFTFDKMEPAKVKGKSEPVPVYRLAEETGQHARGFATQGISSPIVGRDAELVAIKGCVNRLLDGQGGILCLIGEAGLGKSRLMAEICNRTDPSSLRWLEGHTLAYGQKISYWPFREIIRQSAGINEEDSELEAWQKLENQIMTLFDRDSGEILPYVAGLLTLEMKGEYASEIRYLDAEAMGRQVFLASRRFFERLAQTKPLMILFEDLHWADESSTLLLEHLLPLIDRVPLLICAASRPEPKTPVFRLRNLATKEFERRYTEIRLSPLSQTESTELMRNLMEVENLPFRVSQTILAKADGNPFFLEEIMRSLIDGQAVVRDPTTDRWRASTRIETITIPDTIQGVIMSRVDRLEGEVKQVLRTASVIGRSFLYRILRGIEEAAKELDHDLENLRAMELIRERQRIPELEYIFKHALVQESTYESILLQKRRQLHARVAQVIETLFSDRLEEFYSTLANHYARAEVWEKAQEYLFKGGDQAGRIAADTEALALYQEALDSYARAFGEKWNPVERASLERKMGEAFYRRGEHQQAAEYLQRALTHLGGSFPKTRSRVRLAIFREVVEQIGHYLLPGIFIKSMNGVVSQEVEEEGRIYETMIWINAFLNREDFLLAAVKALNFSERRGYLLGVVLGSGGLEGIAQFLSFFRISEYYGSKTLRFSEKMQYRGALGYAYQGIAYHNFLTGNLNKAIEYARRAADAYRKGGSWNLRGWGIATMILNGSYILLGDLSKAITYAEDLVRFGEDSSDRQIWSWGLGSLGFTQNAAGRLKEAVSSLRKAIELSEAIPDYNTRVYAGGELGRCYLRQENFEAALKTLIEAEHFYDEHNVKGHFLSPVRNGLAEAHLLAAERSHGTERRNWLKKSKGCCRDALKQGKAFRPGLIEAMRLKGTYEWLAEKPTSAQKWWQRSSAAAEAGGMRYESGKTHLEMATRLKECAHLEKAKAIFAEIGIEYDLAQTPICTCDP